MKTLRFIGMVLMTILLGTGFAACSSDDDDVSSPEANLSKTAKMFLGYWKETSSYSSNLKYKEFFFFADGTCDLISNSGITHGDWTYNDTTKILATTTGGWQYNVTLLKQNAWAGVSLGGSNANSFERADSTEAASYMLGDTSWETDTLTLTIRREYANAPLYISGTIVDAAKFRYGSPSIEIYDGKDTLGIFRMKYEIYGRSYYTNKAGDRAWESKKQGAGTVDVTNAFTYNKKKMRLVFTGSLNGTVTCKGGL